MIVPVMAPDWPLVASSAAGHVHGIDLHVRRRYGGTKGREAMTETTIRVTREMVEAAANNLQESPNWNQKASRGRALIRARDILEIALAAAPTPPIRGSADGAIEPKPFDYSPERMDTRNIEALYEITSRQSQEIHALREQVQALTVQDNAHGLAISKLFDRVEDLEIAAIPDTPDQPADDAELRSAVTPDQSDTVYDAKWEAVHAAYQHAGLGPYDEFKAAVAEAVKQGLVPRVDPDLDGGDK